MATIGSVSNVNNVNGFINALKKVNGDTSNSIYWWRLLNSTVKMVNGILWSNPAVSMTANVSAAMQSLALMQEQILAKVPNMGSGLAFCLSI